MVDLGNGDFAVSDNDTGGKPSLLVVDPSDPNNIIVAAAQVPSGVHGITVSGEHALRHDRPAACRSTRSSRWSATRSRSRSNLPAGTAANIVPGSYNIPPTQINTSASGDTLVWDRVVRLGQHHLHLLLADDAQRRPGGRDDPA